MDPFGLTVGVASLITICAQTFSACRDILSSLEDAPRVLSSIQLECSTTREVLSLMFVGMNKSDTTALSHLSGDIAQKFDIALTGCTVTLSALDNELQKTLEHHEKDGKADLVQRAKYAWNEDSLKDALDELRGQRDALHLLTTVVESHSVAEILRLLREKDIVFIDVKRRTDSLHRPREQVTGVLANDEWDTTGAYSIFSDGAGEDRFDFDSDIFRSPAYRRVYNSVRNGRRLPYNRRARFEPTVNLLEEEDLIELREHPPLIASYSRELREEMLPAHEEQQPIGPMGPPGIEEDHNDANDAGSTIKELPAPMLDDVRPCDASASTGAEESSSDPILHSKDRVPSPTNMKSEVKSELKYRDGESPTGENKPLHLSIVTLGPATDLQDELIGASASGRVGDVREYLLRSNLNIEEPQLRLPLLYACMNGHTEVIDQLLLRGANVNCQYPKLVYTCGRNHRNLGPLHLAAANDHPSTIALLLERGAKITQLDEWSWSPLHFAAAKESVSAVKVLLQNGAPMEAKAALDFTGEMYCSPRDVSKGCTPLFVSAACNASKALRTLLDHGANKNAKAGFGLTFLHAAAGGCSSYVSKFGELTDYKSLRHMPLFPYSWSAIGPDVRYRVPLLDYLVSIGCDFEVADDFGFKPIHTDLSSATHFGWTPLHMAALSKTAKMAEALLKAGARINAPFGQLRGELSKFSEMEYFWERALTPLGVAVVRRHSILVIYLLQNGADTTLPARPNLSILHVAALTGESDILVLLSKQGLGFENLDRKSKWKPPKAYSKASSLLSSHRLDINTLDETGNTPLLRLSSLAFPPDYAKEAILSLLRLGADPRIRCREGHSVLHYSSYFLDQELFDALMKAGANLEAKDNNGRTPLLRAAKWGSDSQVERFIGRGANIYARDNSGKSAWDLSSQHLVNPQGRNSYSAVKGVLDHAAKTRRPPKEPLDHTAMTRQSPKGWKIWKKS